MTLSTLTVDKVTNNSLNVAAAHITTTKLIIVSVTLVGDVLLRDQ
jgi:hypothetical protein